jgi:hypothetical protein
MRFIRRSIRWRTGGSIATALDLQAQFEFLAASPFARRDEFLRYSVLAMSLDNHVTILSKLHALAGEFDERACGS